LQKVINVILTGFKVSAFWGSTCTFPSKTRGSKSKIRYLRFFRAVLLSHSLQTGERHRSC